MTPPTHKRKVQNETMDSSPPLKRARKASVAAKYPHTANASSCSPVSSPDLRTNRKRKTDSDSNCDPPAKHVHTRSARGTQPPPAGKLARTCRPVRGAKTQAVARMAGVA
ncbi:hypothetical protein CYLTODRAFT_460178 [Cylindrobasidium torrendii FP15055 ss-10]|uniref:Uncharacterized protein n=1 Tax=Cylindrobasidium torrendii FP15055 ss-10 TaxID=1314674 RepID=A0A0D7AT91_9AGAR|nr:hypothetical protein CYLTODRAFT_460178 [Cylindrobasidium torrendii FP15055 ss-10]